MISVGLVQTPSANSALIAVIGVIDSGGAAEVTSIVQGAATWQRAAQGGTGDLRVEIWYSIDAGGETTAITINTVGDGDETAIVTERAQVGSIGSTAVDQVAVADATGSTTLDTGQTALTAYAVELAVGAFASDGGAPGSPTNGFTITDQVVSGSLRLVSLAKTTIAAEQAQTTATVTSSDYGGAMATFFSHTLISLTSVTPDVCADDGGYLVDLGGSFADIVGKDITVHVGTTGTDNDAKCLSGVPESPTTLATLGTALVRAYTPELAQGVQKIHIRSTDGLYQRTLLSALTVFPQEFETTVFDLRRVLPPRWRKGALTIEEEA